MEKCTQCNLNFEGLCDNYGQLPIEDAIKICETNEFIMYPPEID